MSERCLVIIPTRNNAAHLAALIEETLLVGDLLGEPLINVLVVDDHSDDGTAGIAEELRTSHRGRVDVLHRLARPGVGSAYVVGFRFALASGYDYVVQMAPDFTHDPSLLPRLLRAAHEADLVLGSRHLGATSASAAVPAWRAALSRAGSYYADLVLRLGVNDLTSGFKCFRRSALEALDLASLKSEDEAFQIEVTYQCAQLGLRIAEVPVMPRDSSSASPVSLRMFWDALLAIWRLRLAGAALLANLGLKSHAASTSSVVPSPRTSGPRRRR